MDCLRKGRAGHPLCFFSVSWHASLLYLTHFNSPTRRIPPLSTLKRQHLEANFLSSYWDVVRDLHVIPLSAPS